MSKKLVNFMAEQVDHEFWKEQAKATGLSFGEWARRRLNGTTVSPRVQPKHVRVPQPWPEEEEPFASHVGKTKISSCPHRLPKGTFCKKCQMIRK